MACSRRRRCAAGWLCRHGVVKSGTRCSTLTGWKRRQARRHVAVPCFRPHMASVRIFLRFVVCQRQVCLGETQSAVGLVTIVGEELELWRGFVVKFNDLVVLRSDHRTTTKRFTLDRPGPNFHECSDLRQVWPETATTSTRR
jgi:hypothetical protein